MIATLTGSGTAVIDLGYMVSGARWRPTYDLQLQPSQNRVEVSLAGLVSQESGEDWTDARLTLSTAIPATATQLPKLLTWKLGERERFIPTPQPQREYVPPAPRVPPLSPAIDADPTEQLQRRFLMRLGLPVRGPTGNTATLSFDMNQRDDQMADESVAAAKDYKKAEHDRDGVADAVDAPKRWPKKNQRRRRRLLLQVLRRLK